MNAKPTIPHFEAYLLGLCEFGPLPERRILSHEEVARELIAGHGASAPEHLVREITKALQNAFDLGFRAAGGRVPLGVDGE